MAVYYIAAVSNILPGRSIDYYLGELPYCQGLQIQTMDYAQNGVEFENASIMQNAKEIAGFFDL